MTSLDIIAAGIFVIAMCNVIITTLTVLTVLDYFNEGDDDGME